MMLATEGSSSGPDCPPKKPKQPFLKRGEGVKRRLDAYKYRRPAEGDEKQQQCTTSDQFEQQSPASDAGKTRKHVQNSNGWLHEEGCVRLPGSNSSKQGDTGGLMAAFAGDGATSAGGVVGQDVMHWSTREAEEALELEEFRALEREILGGSQQHGQQGQRHQQPLNGGLPASISAKNSSATAAPTAAPGVEQGISLSAEGPELGNGSSSSQLIQFQDDTEWVDTEFSFAGLMEQQQEGLQGQVASQQQQQQQHMQYVQHMHLQHEQPLQAAPVGLEGSDETLAQPFVRSLFNKAAGSSNGSGARAGVAAGSRARQHAAAAAAVPERAAANAVGEVVGELGGMQLLAIPADQVARWQQMEAAQPNIQQEKAALKKMRVELERAATRLEHERIAWEKQKASAQASLEAWRSEEARRLARERRVLEQQSKALLNLPSKRDKAALADLEAAMERERSEARAAAARHRLTLERLRCQIKELQDRNAELREEVRWHEAQQLNSTAFAATDAKQRRKPAISSVQTQTDAAMRQQQQSGTAAAAAAASAAAAKLESAGSGQGPRSSRQAVSPAGTTADPLYAALFGDDAEEEAPGGGAHSSHVTAAAAAAVSAAGQPASGAVGLPAGAAAAAAAGRSKPIIKGQPGTAGRLQAGRKIGNTVTVKPSVTWANQQQQQKQGAADAAARVAAGVGGCSNDGSSSSSFNQQNGLHSAAAAAAAGDPGSGDDDSSFSFAPVAPAAAAAQAGSAALTTAGSPSKRYQPQQQSQVQQQQQLRGVGRSPSKLNHNASSNSGADIGPAAAAPTTGTAGMTMTRFSAFDSYLMDQYDHELQQQQQQQQSAAAIGHSSYIGGNLGNSSSTKSSSDRYLLEGPSAAGSYSGYSPSGAATAAASRPAAAAAAGSSAGRQIAAAAAAAVGDAGELIQELVLPDGKLEQLFADGSRVVQFANGTVKTCRLDGSTFIRFRNGDVKRQLAGGRVDYYYAEVATWQSSHPGGTEVFYFPSGQVEGHHPDGMKDIIFPDGSIRRVTADGYEQEITAGMLTAAVKLPPPDLDSMP